MNTLKRLREKAQMTRHELCLATGLTNNTVMSHEQGRNAMGLKFGLIYAKALAPRLRRTPSSVLLELAEAQLAEAV